MTIAAGPGAQGPWPRSSVDGVVTVVARSCANSSFVVTYRRGYSWIVPGRHTLLGMGDIQTTGRRREVGAALKRIRQELGWPAYRLAERLDWTPSHISRSEAHVRRAQR